MYFIEVICIVVAIAGLTLHYRRRPRAPEMAQVEEWYEPGV